MPAAPTRKTKATSRGWNLLRLLLTFAVAAWAIRALLFAPFSIPSGSMLPTLRIGDYLLVAKWPYGYSRFSFPFGFPSFGGRILAHLPERGDIVVFVPRGEDGEDFVKRVIGLPGDTVEVRSGALVLNGRPVQRSAMEPVAVPISANSPCRRVTELGIALTVTGEEACIYRGYRETLANGASYTVIDQVENGSGDDYPATVVPPGHLFLMGDNRDDSLDSRFPVGEGGIGPVPLDRLVGRATVLFWSTDGSASYWKPWSWFAALRAERIGRGLGSGAQ